MVKKNFLLIICMILLFVSPIITSDKVFIEQNNGLLITTPNQEYLPQNENHKFNFHLQRMDDGTAVTDNETDCQFFLYCNEGNTIHYANASYSNDVNNWYVNVSGENLTRIGEYNYYIVCENDLDKLGGSRSEQFWVNEGGFQITKEQSITGLGLVSLVFILMMVCIFTTFKSENYITKFIFYWLSHLSAILFTFTAWQLSYEIFLSSIGIGEVFRILFHILGVAVFPMVLVSIAWIVYIHTFNDHVRKLIEDGEDPETAFQITKRKKGGWLYGK